MEKGLKALYFCIVDRLALTHGNLASNFFNCRVLAIKQSGGAAAAAPTLGSSTNMDFSVIEISRLQ